MLFSKELARRLGSKNLLSFSLHPGVIHTNLARSLEMKDFAEMGKT
jgi:NAD(P)-dependent dehydrogenase (short-subunit alcohol dehydrogenase family)